MLRMANLDELAAHEADEMDLIIDVRNRQRRRRQLRAELLTADGDRVGVRARIHLLEAEVEHQLRERLTALEDALALLRHAQLDAPHLEHELARVTAQRATAAEFLDERTPVVDTTVGRPPAGGADWSLADVPLAALDVAETSYAALRDGLVEAVDNVVDSELLVVSGGRGPGDDIAELTLVEHDPDAVAQVVAFVTDMRMIGSAADLLRERLRLAALRRSVDNPRGWLLDERMRRRDARNALDRSRAVHAALAELNRAAELTE